MRAVGRGFRWAVLLSLAATFGVAGEGLMTYRELTPTEEQVMLHKGTEAPFTGEYWNHFLRGQYVCRRCAAPLYLAHDKFDSGCGWPSFDDEIAGAVRREPDADGRRTEILCARCGAHLGHVFEGERKTEKNVRHCVNSISLDFIPIEAAPIERAVFAAGCFWGVEALLQDVPGVLRTTVGYAGGSTERPTYREVCSGQTGHAEAVEVLFDPARLAYRDLAMRFFEIHDPSQKNRQGPDVGSQYRSAAFPETEAQREVLNELIGRLRASGQEVVTALEPPGPFWPAETHHQDYFRKNRQPHCHVHTPRFASDE